MEAWGVRDLRAQNEAFVMKLCWGLPTRPNALWVECIVKKYGCGTGKYPIMKKKREQSGVWSSILAVWDKFFKAVGCKIGDGKYTNVWTDMWTGLDLPLIQYVERNHDKVRIEDVVASFVTASNTWDLDKWRTFLPDWVIDRIRHVAPPRPGQADKHWWRAAADGNFSVRSAYRLTLEQPTSPIQPIWRKIWRWELPEKVKMFIWQVFHERIPSNHVRARHIPNISPECPFECHSEETVLHTLRDCETAQRVWSLVINPIYMYRFFTGNLQDWLN